AWVEKAATWNMYASAKPWEIAGAKGSLDRDATVIGSITPSSTGPQSFFISPAVVQDWVDNPASNQGIIIADEINTDGFDFYTRESSTVTQRPQLTVHLVSDTTPPETSIDSGVSGTVNVSSAKFAFSSSEIGSTFECSLDGGSFSNCSSPKEYTRLADGAHTFQVRATDPAGNTDSTPASSTWTVDTTSIQGDPVMVGAGDIAGGTNNNDEATAELIRYIPGTVFTVGDNVYDTGSLTEFNSYYDPTWGTEKARTKPSVGNHEYISGSTRQYGAGYFDYFGAVAARENAGSYSYDLGDWHIISLNTGQCYGAAEADGSIPRCGPGDPMLVWLESDLKADQKSCTLAYFHHSRWSSGSTHGSDPARAKAIWDMLYAYNADVVVAGHNHNYERFAPQDQNGNRDDARGIREFVAGTGGESHQGFGTILPNSEIRNSDTYGVLKLTLHAGSYDWQFVPVAGKTFTDSGTAGCH
ncbi:MAG TPA: metallophosphoesterase, partial [Rubrobacter sp.]|nr:metallophosphoesterase [Rubrobacter sp.]